MSDPTAPTDFWYTLETAGLGGIKAIATPLGAGVSQTFKNLVSTGQNKVAAIAQVAVQTTDPNKGAATSQPSAPPTTGGLPPPVPKTTGSPLSTSSVSTLVLILGVVALFFFLRKR